MPYPLRPSKSHIGWCFKIVHKLSHGKGDDSTHLIFDFGSHSHYDPPRASAARVTGAWLRPA